MELVEIGPDDLAAVDAYVDLGRACDAADLTWWKPRTRLALQQEMRHGWDGEKSRFFLAHQGAETVGTLEYFAPEHDNHELSWIEAKVAPHLRRRGHGRVLLGEAEALARSLGRPLVIALGEESEAARALAAVAGYPLGSTAVARVQPLDGSGEERSRFEALRAEAEAFSAGYDLVRIDGRTPAEYLDGVVQVTAAINDAPLDDLEYEDEVFDADRIRAYESAQLACGSRFRRVLAIERATGTIVGHTVVGVDGEQPVYAEQHDTAVVPAHRGHRLGLRLKSDMLCWLAEVEPELRWIETGNAASNGPMIAVNERLGYQVAGRRLQFQRRV